MSDLLLNISSTVSHSRANGPGLRAVVWVQGCSIGCKLGMLQCIYPFAHKKFSL